MASASDESMARVLLNKLDKRGAALHCLEECNRARPAEVPGVGTATTSGSTCPHNLNELLDILLSPGKPIDDYETIDWCKWLIAGGRAPDEFANTVRSYDNVTVCGRVWTPKFVAYRCRTCGISPSASLCLDCFQKGNHIAQRHDWKMFLSQAGGACDCGDTSVMKETGFCNVHGPNSAEHKPAAPYDLMSVAEAMMPRIILRLIHHLRQNCKVEQQNVSGDISSANNYLNMLTELDNMGGLMRRVITTALTNPQKYRQLMDPAGFAGRTDYEKYCQQSNKFHQEALDALPNPDPPEEYQNFPPLQKNLKHTTFLEELVFWTVVNQFPEKLVCLLLKMLPDPDYKESLTRAFILHYSRISMMLERSSDPEALSNRVVHVTVQLFSNESLAVRMVDELKLVHVMIISLKYMMNKIIIHNTLHDPDRNFHYVVDCRRQVIYWPLVSDLNNILCHYPVAERFMKDDTMLEMWFEFLSMIQGMNVNKRETNQVVDLESDTYFAAFSTELQGSASPMWTLVSHLRGPETVELTRRVLNFCLTTLQHWLGAINYTSPTVSDNQRCSFHLPLHRYFAVFLCQAVRHQGASLNELLPSTEMLHLLMMHPLRVQVVLYEIIISELWNRNGLQISGQAITYVQNDFCNSMVDADIYLLQICAMKLQPDIFLSSIIEKFHVKKSMSLKSSKSDQSTSTAEEFDVTLLQSCLTFLAILVSIRTNLGISDHAMLRLEIVTLLCMGDKTHSQLKELMPEHSGTALKGDFESVLAEVADYKPPNLDASGNILPQGMYGLKSCAWDKFFDPVYVLLRNVEKKDFRAMMERFANYARQSGKLKNNVTPWPPFRSPTPVSPEYVDPRVVLSSKMFHAMIFVILYKAVNGHNIPEHVMSLAIYLLEMAVETAQVFTSDSSDNQSNNDEASHVFKDMDLACWFNENNLFENLRTLVPRVISDKDEKEPQIIQVQESIISLLLKLQSQLSEASDCDIHEPLSETLDETSLDLSSSLRIGDGTYFISQLLKKISDLDPLCKDSIIETKIELNKNKQRDRKNREREERRKRAKERQMSTMAEFANKQKKFLENSQKLDVAGVSGVHCDSNEGQEQVASEMKYNCIICNLTTSSTIDKPMGLVILVQSTSILGHERRDGRCLVLPTSDEDPPIPYPRDDTRMFHTNSRKNELDKSFEKSFWLQSIDVDVEGGVYVQTCGHHLHLDCLKNYLPHAQSQYNSERQKKLAFEKGEYQCPLCRQVANSALPLSPRLGESSPSVSPQPTSFETILSDLHNYFKEEQFKPDSTNLSLARQKAIDDIKNSTYFQNVQVAANFKSEICSKFLFVSSLLRTNFEIEILQRGGSLVDSSSATSYLVPKRDCKTALLYLLAEYTKELKKWPVHRTWQKLTDLPSESETHLSDLSAREVPLLLNDPTTLLIQFILSLPLDLEQSYYLTIVKVVFNLLFYQILVQISCDLTPNERKSLIGRGIGDEQPNPIKSEDILKTVIYFFCDSKLYHYDDDSSLATNCSKLINLSIEQQVQALSLPFLRFAALIRYRLYDQPIPIIDTPETEFVKIADFLELIPESMESECFNAASALQWHNKEAAVRVPASWCEHFRTFVCRNRLAARNLIVDQHISWKLPKLLNLPREYEKIFLYYHKQACKTCHRVPQELSLCLLCGTIVCLKKTCCKGSNIEEAVKHSIDCGSGTGIFLVVSSTYVIVIRGIRACLWGSLYLDDFEEEDIDLRRGKPLYLSQDRYKLLEQQWLAHRFDYTKKNWTLHQDS